MTDIDIRERKRIRLPNGSTQAEAVRISKRMDLRYTDIDGEWRVESVEDIDAETVEAVLIPVTARAP